PSQRRPGLSNEVDRVVLKALEKSGGRRHLTLRQLLNEVEALVAQASPSGGRKAVDEVATAKTMMSYQEPRTEPRPVVSPPADMDARPTMDMRAAMPEPEPAPAPQRPSLVEVSAPVVEAPAPRAVEPAPRS